MDADESKTGKLLTTTTKNLEKHGIVISMQLQDGEKLRTYFLLKAHLF